ncbi:carbohydrate porin [Methylobacterium sp. Leaf399]|uniref:carbohydrate porin n=1 Tax=Methylobacterium sp. Leaf399 TaxID=1736364 RepID=UPI001FCD1AB9|nr:carbohydrate porin [Methylobacterium sp. Leaf399]
MAQPDIDSPLADRPVQSAAVEPESDSARPASIQSSLGAFGDPGGFRAALGARGITYNAISTNEALGNVTGGFARGPIYAGKLETIVTADLGTLAGLDGLTFFANAFQIHDTGGLRDRSFGRLITVSNIEALPSTRLSEIWLEQKWAGDRFAVRFGQLVADGEFFSSDTGKLFVSNDWPTITGANLPGGGPAYPLATPGVRLRYDPNAAVSALVAIFNGDPGDQRIVNRTGTNFRLGDPPLVMAEAQVRYNQGTRARGLAGSLKLGGYRHFGRFDDLRFDTAGLPLASPFANGVARRLRGTGGVYGVVDQQLHRPEGAGPDGGVSVYARISGSPADRNLIDLWADGGVVCAGMIPGRPDDRFGASVIYARIGDGARAADIDGARWGHAYRPVRSFEATVELSYQARIAPGWIVQPDIQYVVNPGGGVENPSRPGTRTRGGLVFGLRSTVVY